MFDYRRKYTLTEKIGNFVWNNLMAICSVFLVAILAFGFYCIVQAGNEYGAACTKTGGTAVYNGHFYECLKK